MTRITATIITLDRAPSENYLPATLDNFERSGGLTSPVLRGLHVIDGGSPAAYVDGLERLREVDPRVFVHRAERRFLPCENAGRALRIGALQAEMGDWILFLEDDLDFCDDFLGSCARWLDNVASPHYRVYAFGAAYPQVDRRNKAVGSWAYPIEKFYGTQALAMRVEDAFSLGGYWLSNPDVQGDPSPGAYDLMLHDWHRKNYPGAKHLLASAPSFIQHEGRQSICTGLKQTHTFGSWLGRAWRYEG